MVSTVWCGPPAVSQASADVARSGAGRQTAQRHGQLGQRLVGRDDLDVVGHQAEPVAEVEQPDDDARRRERRRNTRRTGSSRPPMPSGWISTEGRSAAMLGQTSSMCAPRTLRLAGAEVVRVVLHEGRPAGRLAGHRLEDAHEGRRLPVTLAAEAVAVGHQPLDGQAGQLAKAAQVLEVARERVEAVLPRGTAAARARSAPRSAVTRAGLRRASSSTTS